MSSAKARSGKGLRFVTAAMAVLAGTAGLTIAAGSTPAFAAAAPVVDSITPSVGPLAGGTAVTIVGTGMKSATSVKIGTASVTVVTDTATQITGTTTASVAGIFHTVVTTANGASSPSMFDLYSYQGNPTVTSLSQSTGPAAGGTSVIITGTNFLSTTYGTSTATVKFGTVAATNVVVNSATQIVATAPAGTGAVDVKVTSPIGTSAATSADLFTYNSTFTVVGGYGAYESGVTTSTGSTATPPPPDQFNALTLVTGGTGVNAASLTVVAQPSSGTLTASSAGLLTYAPAETTTSSGSGANTVWTYTVTTTGTQTATIALCPTSVTYPNAACQNATMTFSQTSSHPMGGVVTIAGISSGVVVDAQSAVVAPATATPGSTISVITAGSASSVPASNSGFTVISASQFSTITQIPVGLTYVPNSLTVTGGDATTSGNMLATYCTAPVANQCTANINTGNYKTVYPYIETFLKSSINIAGGSNFTLPTVTAQFTVNAGTAGQALSSYITEFVSATDVATLGNGVLDAYPSDDNPANQGISKTPAYDAPTPAWTVNVPSGPPPPTVTSVSPTYGSAAGGTSVVIAGTTLTGATAVNFGSTAATSYTVNSATQITATAPAGSGTVDVTVTTGSGTSPTSASDLFTYYGPPTVTGIVPTAGPPTGGTSVIITGTNFAGVTGVKFGTVAASGFTVNSATQVTATSPAGSGTVDVTVTAVGGTSATVAADLFTYSSGPTIASVSPNAGPLAGGTSVVIAGTTLTGATAVDFGSTAATSYTVNSDTQVTAIAPAGSAGSVGVTVTVGAAISNSVPYTYDPVPTVTSLLPNDGPLGGGTSVAITGTGFTSGSTVHFGTSASSAVTFNSATSITATAPAGTGTVDVTVSTPGGTSATSSADQFTYYAAPTVTLVAPSSGPAGGGTAVTLTGTGFVGGTGVKFGTTAATGVTVVSPTSVTATAPAGTGTVDVVVTAVGGTSATSPADHFTYIPAPVVSSVSPGSGPVAGGTSVTITGTTFTGVTAVDFGSTAATSFTVTSATSITATAPAGTGTVDVKVTADGGTSTANAHDRFTYFAVPTVKSVSPNSGPSSGKTVVTITGTNLGGATEVDFGTSAATISSGSATSVTVTAPAGFLGTVDVTVTTPGGKSATSAADRYTYTSSLPFSQVLKGYWEVTARGAVLANGTLGALGDPSALVLNHPIVGFAATPDLKGYWLVASDGGIFTYGDAHFYGSMGGKHLNSPIVGIARTPGGKGYWLVAADGGVFSFGNATFHGSMGGQHLNQPIVGIASDGVGGYWLVARDGGIFSFGGALFHGSMGAKHLNAPIVGMAGNGVGGYWLAAADGGVFSFGSAHFKGSAASGSLRTHIVGIATNGKGGYELAGANGGVFTYGATFFGSYASASLNSPVVAIGS